ncbi:MAG: histidine kinase dimerization/phospho-acceptor domain-containing protein [Desulfocurvibacter africanus]
MRCKAREEAFVLGFTWAVGTLLWRPLLGQAYGGGCPPELASQDECLRPERLHAGVNHLQIAASALRHWGFPQRATACLVCAEEAGPDAVVLRSCCELADLLTRLLFSGFQDVLALFELGKARLGTDADELGDILLAAASELAREAETLVPDVDLQRALRDLLRKAERSVTGISGQPGMPRKTGLPSFESLAPGSKSEEVLEAVAHEVRNPLMAVAGFARKLMDTVNPASREGEYAQIILEEGQRLEAALARMQPGSRR